MQAVAAARACAARGCPAKRNRQTRHSHRHCRCWKRQDAQAHCQARSHVASASRRHKKPRSAGSAWSGPAHAESASYVHSPVPAACASGGPVAVGWLRLSARVETRRRPWLVAASLRKRCPPGGREQGTCVRPYAPASRQTCCHNAQQHMLTASSRRSSAMPASMSF